MHEDQADALMSGKDKVHLISRSHSKTSKYRPISPNRYYSRRPTARAELAMVENKQVVEYRLEGWNGAQQLVKTRYFRATRPIFLTSLLPQACAFRLD